MKKFKEIREALQQVREDGHTDVASAVRQCKTAIEDASQMLSKLQGMNPEDSLPSWWMNKIAIAANNMNKLRDYLLVPSTKEAKEMREGKGGKPESFEAQYKRRLVKTTKPEHKAKGYNWRIKGKDRPEISIKLYKSKPGQAEFNKQLRRVAGHEFGG
tara:strand:+ start:813 stop:1286 length:474 start_codon:yes stop_codon:yes gene_type:complete